MDKKESLNYIHKTLNNREIGDYKFDINTFIKATEILYKEYTRLITDNYILSEREKQQKEIEELKEQIELFKNANNNACSIMQEIINKNYINKDKIKVKIEELEIEQESNREDLKIAIDNLLFQNIDKIADKISINMRVRAILKSLLEGSKYMLDKEELEYLQEIINNEILSYLESGYKVTSDYVIVCRKILKKLNLKEIYNFDKE